MGSILPMFFGNISYYILSFFKTVHKLTEMDLFAFRILCPEGLGFTFGIVGNYFIGCVKDIPGGTVVLFQPDDLRIRENSLKSKDVTDIGSSEFVNGLVIITNYTEILITGSQKADKLKLCGIGILVFIHHNITKSFLIIFQYIATVLEKFYSFYNQIVEIQCVISSQGTLVFSVDLGYFFLVKICSCIHEHLIWCDQFILGMGNLCQKRAFFVFLGIDIQFAADFFHKGLLVIGIVNGKISIITQAVYVPSQNANTGGMKGGYPDAASHLSCDLVYSFSHLLGCLIGKGNGQYVPWIYVFLCDQIGDPVGQYSGLAGTCPCQNKKRPICVKDSLSLGCIQCVIYTHEYSPRVKCKYQYGPVEYAGYCSQ